VDEKTYELREESHRLRSAEKLSEPNRTKEIERIVEEYLTKEIVNDISIRAIALLPEQKQIEALEKSLDICKKKGDEKAIEITELLERKLMIK